MGLWVLVALPLLTLLLHLLQLEVFMWPDAFSWAVLLLCGLVGTAFADICWGQSLGRSFRASPLSNLAG